MNINHPQIKINKTKIKNHLVKIKIKKKNLHKIMTVKIKNQDKIQSNIKNFYSKQYKIIKMIKSTIN